MKSNFSIEQWIEHIDKELFYMQKQIETMKVKFELLKDLKEKAPAVTEAN